MKETIQIDTNKNRLDIPQIHHFLSTQAYWAKGRSMEKVKRSIENSLCFGVYVNNSQAGFARVVSDYTIFAWLLDVFILPEYRGHGLGKKLVQTIMSHDDLQGLRRWGLATEDAHGLYRQFGFQTLKNPDLLMEITTTVDDR
jgi:GNAT superfamily N-acetyltransferase